MDLYYLCADNICCVCSLVQNRTNLGASSGLVPDKFRSSFGVLTSFVLKFVREEKWIVSFLSTDILVYVALYRTRKIWEQAPDTFWTSYGQVPDKFCFQTCLRVVRRSNLSASYPRLHRNSWVLYWTSSSCPKTKLVRKFSGVVRRRTTIGQVSSYRTSFIAGCCASCRRTRH